MLPHLLTNLWLYAADQCADGNLSGTPAARIKRVCGWDGDAQLLIGKLIEHKLIDSIGDELHIHDWCDYAGKVLAKRKYDREAIAKKRAKAAGTKAAAIVVTTPPRVEALELEQELYTEQLAAAKPKSGLQPAADPFAKSPAVGCFSLREACQLAESAFGQLCPSETLAKLQRITESRGGIPVQAWRDVVEYVAAGVSNGRVRTPWPYAQKRLSEKVLGVTHAETCAIPQNPMAPHQETKSASPLDEQRQALHALAKETGLDALAPTDAQIKAVLSACDDVETTINQFMLGAIGARAYQVSWTAFVNFLCRDDNDKQMVTA